MRSPIEADAQGARPVLDSAFGEIITTCSKLEWLIKDGEKHLRPETRAGNLILSHKRAKVHFSPLGTVVACVSWNYRAARLYSSLTAPGLTPLSEAFHNALSPIVASIFAGNSIVLKCSEQVAWSSMFFVDAVRKCIAACGFDAEIVQVGFFLLSRPRDVLTPSYICSPSARRLLPRGGAGSPRAPARPTHHLCVSPGLLSYARLTSFLLSHRLGASRTKGLSPMLPLPS